MRLFYSACFTLFTIASSAQVLKVNEVDKFTKQKRLQTDESTIKSGLIDGIKTYIRVVDSSVLVHLKGYGTGATMIGANDKIIFLLSDESTVVGYSPTMQSYEIGSKVNTFNHYYRVSSDDLKVLSEKDLKGIRVYSSSGYRDFDIPKRNREDLRKQAALILQNL
jgi:hypothetical protein